MTTSHNCPLCSDSFEAEPDLRVHLEVEHRKSELAVSLIENTDTGGDPTVEGNRDEDRDRDHDGTRTRERRRDREQSAAPP